MTTTQAPSKPRAGMEPELRRLAVVVILGAVMTILDTTIVNVAISTLGTDFHTSLSTIQWVLTGYTLALSMSIPITGWAVERFGAKTMWLVSLGLFIAGSLLCGVAWSAASLIGFRVLQGIGGGMIMPIGQTMLARKAGPDRMGRVMSVVALPAMLAPVLGPVVGGLVVDHLSWRWLFYINAPFCVLAVLASVRMLPRDAERRPEARLDLAGLAMLSPGLAALVYGLAEWGNGAAPTSARFLISVIGGAGLLAGFATHALRRGDRALVDIRLFRHRAFTTGTLSLFVYSGAVIGAMMLLPLYFQAVRAETPLGAGLMMAPLGVGAIITMPLAGRLSDRYGARPLAATGVVIVGLGLLVYSRLDASTATGLLLGAVFVIGLGHGMMMPPLMAAVYQGLSRDSVPSATTGVNVMVRVGSSVGTAVLAVLLQVAIRDEIPGASGRLEEVAGLHAGHLADRLSHAFGTGFWWAIGIAAVSLIPILLIPRRRTKNA